MTRKLTAVLCLIVIGIGLCSCGSSHTPFGREVVFRLTNTVPDQIAVLTVSWTGSENTISSTDIEIAGGGDCLDTRTYAFALTRHEVPHEEALQNLTVTVSVSDQDGVTHTLPGLALCAAFGDTFDYELRYAHGGYEIWACK